MIKNVAVLFYLKKRANSKEEKVPVYIRITCDGQRAELATGQKIQAKLWNPSEESAKGKTEAVYKLNSAVNYVELKINDTIRYLKDCGEELTAEKVKNRFLGKTEKPIMLICHYLLNPRNGLQPYQCRCNLNSTLKFMLFF
ncbi:Arm DNA-binding domain-containing protein [Mucilaginibacter sp. Mucisp86]|uniref:Arm DNA-binding domain-containing protein n=1 Tax=Mucilaginibacter sp. Mucisp86 TaxID=3243060 RepID=UPI0039B55517